jgi:glyoxylase-like metal-dependent hydrolase (beta-lactamase superfamily II)
MLRRADAFVPLPFMPENIEARMPVIIEIATFKLAPGTTAAQFAPVDQAMERNYISKQPGFISRESAAGDDGDWLVVNHWKSVEDAEAAMVNFAGAPATQAFMSLLDPKTMFNRHYRKTASATTLNWRHFPAGPNGFFRAPVLLTGAKEALLIDGGFTLPDGRALAAEIKASGKTLSTIYVSQSDPDYYFGLGPVKAAFPDATVVAAAATAEAIKTSVQAKLEVWGPQLKENGPQTVADVVMPAVDDAKALTLEGAAVEIVEASGLINRRYLYVPSLEAVFGGILIFSGVHVWTADTSTSAQRAAWVRELDAIAARKPKVVIPGHLAEGAAIDGSAITYTRDYLLAFEEELAKAKDSAALIEAMKLRYPAAGMDVALDIGAKVAKGELEWG